MKKIIILLLITAFYDPILFGQEDNQTSSSIKPSLGLSMHFAAGSDIDNVMWNNGYGITMSAGSFITKNIRAAFNVGYTSHGSRKWRSSFDSNKYSDPVSVGSLTFGVSYFQDIPSTMVKPYIGVNPGLTIFLPKDDLFLNFMDRFTIGVTPVLGAIVPFGNLNFDFSLCYHWTVKTDFFEYRSLAVSAGVLFDAASFMPKGPKDDNW